MTCREFVEFLMAYLDEEMASDKRGVFEHHMELCPNCGEYLRTYEDTIRAGQLACDDRDELPDDVPEQLVNAILAAREAS